MMILFKEIRKTYLRILSSPYNNKDESISNVFFMIHQ